MPSFDIVRKTTPSESFRINAVRGMFGLEAKEIQEHFCGNFALPEKWNIGLIVGRSGTGKTTIAKELFGANLVSGYEWTHDNILDDMPKSATIKDITSVLTSVGFSSPPSWLKPFSVLSNGEKMRCEIARAMLGDNDFFAFDEFTSVVDRNIAKVSSLAIQKAIRRKGKKFIAITCHYDVEEYLMPDWVFCTDDMTFSLLNYEEQKKNRPELKIEIYETENKMQFWEMFRKYHYLSNSFNKAARVFIALCNGVLCAFTAVLPFPHPYKKNTYRSHRTVVFPEFQGIGIGTALTDFVAEIYKKEGRKMITTTSNPACIHALKKSPKWRTTNIGRCPKLGKTSLFTGVTSNNRITFSFEYL